MARDHKATRALRRLPEKNESQDDGVLGSLTRISLSGLLLSPKFQVPGTRQTPPPKGSPPQKHQGDLSLQPTTCYGIFYVIVNLGLQ